MIEVVPAIIPESLPDLEESVSRVAGLVPKVQIDIEDGSYAPERSWPYQRPQADSDADFLRIQSEENGLPLWNEMDYELDMLVREPEAKLEAWIQAGISGVIFHVESTDNIALCIEKARYADLSVGLALKPSTPNEAVLEWIEEIDFVQFMGNDKIGYHGVELDKRVQKKIRELRKDYPDLIIGVDIGVDEETAPGLVDAGATKLVSGSAIFDSIDVENAIDKLRNL